VVGARNENKNYNDQRVLGNVRYNWTKFTTNRRTKKKSKEYVRLMNILFKDANTIRSIIEKKENGEKHRNFEELKDLDDLEIDRVNDDPIIFKNKVLTLCRNCRISREINHTPIKDQLCEENETTYTTIATKSQIEYLSNELRKLNLIREKHPIFFFLNNTTNSIGIFK